jgi:hypothetical protein
MLDAKNFSTHLVIAPIQNAQHEDRRTAIIRISLYYLRNEIGAIERKSLAKGDTTVLLKFLAQPMEVPEAIGMIT